MNETAKAMRRRFVEDETGKNKFKWERIFEKGKGIDVGCGPDKLPFANCEPFDKEHGDANDLLKYFPRHTFYYVHSSQSLEHMVDPKLALESWIHVTEPKGFIIVTVPDFVLYEGLRWPSQYNPDHKSTWSLHLPSSPSPQHIHVPSFLKQFSDVASVRLCRIVDNNYDYKLLGGKDQTYNEAEGVEAFIEFVLQKKI